MKRETVLKRVNQALDLFYKKDHDLIRVDAHERSIAHRFASYIEALFPRYHVDVEYDRHGQLKKRLERIRECRVGRTDRILPDIIIHRRGNDYNNLAVFEI